MIIIVVSNFIIFKNYFKIYLDFLIIIFMIKAMI